MEWLLVTNWWTGLNFSCSRVWSRLTELIMSNILPQVKYLCLVLFLSYFSYQATRTYPPPTTLLLFSRKYIKEHHILWSECLFFFFPSNIIKCLLRYDYKPSYDLLKSIHNHIWNDNEDKIGCTRHSGVLSWLDSHCFFPSQQHQQGYKVEKECDDQHFNNFIVNSKGFLST